MVFFFVTVLKL